MDSDKSELPPGSILIIEGITQDGETFRPNDWAERMGCSLASFKNHRIYYSPLLLPQVIQGKKCLVVSETLKALHPEIYEQVLSFAKKNHLKTQISTTKNPLDK